MDRMKPKGAVSIGQTNVTGSKLQRVAATVALADQITGTAADDGDITDALKAQKLPASPENIAAVRTLLKAGKPRG